MKKHHFIFILILGILLPSCGSPKKIQGYELFEYTGDASYKSPCDVNQENAQNQYKDIKDIEDLWWEKTNFYHIWVKSFKDSNNDGCGDFPGIEAELDYIIETGFTGIWLSPIFECSYKSKKETDNMHGYDTTDFYKVNSFFSGKDGTEETSENAEKALISLINACHKKGIKIIFDFVPNHTSSQNQWFLDSASNKNNKRKWYIWSDKKLSWDNSMNKNNFYSNGSSYYYAAFSSGMPDLNFRNYEVREEMKNVVRYWLNKGFDGLRVDAARYLIENSSKAYDTQETHDFFKELRSEIDKYSSPKFMVCEAWIENNPSELKKYWGNQNEFNMIFDFNQGRKINESVKNQSESFTSKIETQRPQKSSFGIFLGNHDEYQERLGTGFSGDYKKINLASAISLLRPAVPFVYYGQELGQKNLLVQGDLRLRGKFNWELKDKQLKEEKSPLTLNKALLNFRNQNKDLFSGGTIKILSANPSSKIASYTISTDDKEILCVFNMTKETIENIEISNYQNSSPSFSCIIGDKDSEITYKDGKITLEKIAPYSVRAYSTKGIEENNIFNDEDYDYTSSDKIPDNVFIPEEMYIRGSFNNWGGYLMEKTESETEVTWEIDIPFNVSGQIQYKFCENNLEDWGSNWGNPYSSDPNHNIIQNVKIGKKYNFSISINKKTGKVTPGFKCVN